MTLKEMSPQYADSAELMRARIRGLRAEVRQQDDPDVVRMLNRRIDDLTPLLRECREIAVLTDRYYERSYHKHERYTL